MYYIIGIAKVTELFSDSRTAETPTENPKDVDLSTLLRKRLKFFSKSVDKVIIAVETVPALRDDL